MHIRLSKLKTQTKKKLKTLIVNLGPLFELFKYNYKTVTITIETY